MIKIVLVAALAVAAFADPLRYRRDSDIIAIAGALAAEGQGGANDNHQAAVLAIGIPGTPGDGWSAPSPGVPANIAISNSGLSGTQNEGSILEVTSNNSQGSLSGIQAVEVDQSSDALDDLEVVASGGDVALGSNSNAAAAYGVGSSAAAGALEILTNVSGWGPAQK